MKVLRKKGSSVEIIAMPESSELERGDYLLATEGDKSLLLQVIDVEYAELPGILEDLLREMVVENIEVSSFLDPYNVHSMAKMVRESRIITCKVRGIVEGGKLVRNSTWLPSRFSAKLRKVGCDYVVKLACGDPIVPISVSDSKDGEVMLDATRLDGALTIITGKKDSGKSHVSKVLILELVAKGCYVVVFDVNGEYVGLCRDVNGKPTKISDKMVVLSPGRGFKVSLRAMGVRTMANVLEHALGTPQNSIREFVRIWESLESAGRLTIRSLIESIRTHQMNESVKEALLSRLYSILSSNVIADDGRDPVEEAFELHGDGLLLVIRLDGLLGYVKRLVVEYCLSRLAYLLSNNKIPPLFLLAEEAHLYLRETYWEDMVTRMRHIGVSPIIVTNQPDSIPETIYRQADNVFLFNFTNERDLENISKSSNVDVETVKKIVPYLPRGSALLIGKVVNDVPIVIKVRRLEAMTMGETKSFFRTRGGRAIGISA